MNKNSAIEKLCHRADQAAETMVEGVYRKLAPEWCEMVIDARAELAAITEDNARLRLLCKKAAEYIDTHVRDQAFFRGDADITVAPSFLPALRASGAVEVAGQPLES